MILGGNLVSQVLFSIMLGLCLARSANTSPSPNCS